MPTYTYECDCGNVFDEILVPYEERHYHPCQCGHVAKMIPAMPTVEIFTPMYCEPFDCDVTGKREWEQIKKGFGVVEKGDRAGIRNEEKSSHAQKIGPQKPRGISYADTQRRLENDRKVGVEIDRRLAQGEL